MDATIDTDLRASSSLVVKNFRMVMVSEVSPSCWVLPVCTSVQHKCLHIVYNYLMPQHSIDQNIFTEVQGTVQCVLLWAIEDNELFSVKGKNIIEILTWDSASHRQYFIPRGLI